MKLFGNAVLGTVVGLSLVGCGTHDVGNGPKLSSDKKTAQLTVAAATGQMVQKVAPKSVPGMHGLGGTASVAASFAAPPVNLKFENKVSESCEKGGKMTGLVKVDASENKGSVLMNLNFEKCEFVFDDPATTEKETSTITLNGRYENTVDFTKTEKAMNFKMVLKGDVEFDGQVDDFAISDFVTEMKSGEDSMKLSMKGSLRTAKEFHEFSQELNGSDLGGMFGGAKGGGDDTDETGIDGPSFGGGFGK